MSPKYPKLVVGWFSAVGLLAPFAHCVTAQDEPAAVPSPTTTTAAPSGPPTVLLLTNGQVRLGEILKDQSGYFVKQKFGTSHYPRRSVERTFRSLGEAYAYKKSLRPEQDPEERMKLASWCLEQKLVAEAKSELSEVLKLYPEHRQARTILANLDRPAADSDVDEGVVRTGLDVEKVSPSDETLQRYREEYARNPRPSGMPAIFDLDVPLAVRRYSEFTRTVHPLLQRRCAKCHNENTPGEFQMTQTRGQRDMGNDLIIRANLEATLRIVDKDDLGRSPILTASGMTHGNGGKPVLGGPNSNEYRILAAWVTSLKPAADTLPSSASLPASPGGGSEGFASSRLNPPVDPALPPTSAPAPMPTPVRSPILPQSAHDPLPDRSAVTTEARNPGDRDTYGQTQTGSAPVPAGSLIPGSDVGMPKNPPPPAAFVPPDLSKVRPRSAQPGTTAPPKPKAQTEDALGPGMVRMADGQIGMKLPNGEIAPVVTEATTSKKDAEGPKKPRKIDTKNLESFLKARPKS